MPGGSKIILNTQPPLHELWLAAKAGGFHFRLDASGRWLDTKDGVEFFQRLSDQASAQSGLRLVFAMHELGNVIVRVARLQHLTASELHVRDGKTA